MKRPAEKVTGVGAVALALALLLGLDPEAAANLGVALGFLPALVTGLVEAGGIRGVVRKLWAGR